MSSQDFAELVLSAKTGGLRKGEDALDDLVVAGARAERETGKQTTSMGKSFTNMGGTVAKAAAGAVAAFATISEASQQVHRARGFHAAQAEVSTLIAGTRQEMDLLAASSREMAKEFGTAATDQVSAFYQAISAGADGVSGAVEVLDSANKLALGGITDVTVGVDALTTAVNAYGPDVLSAAAASDAMFVGMKAGKTTIGELSRSLGQIVPIASAAGVSFDEVVAGIAALTAQGLSTSTATTSLRQVLASVIAPTKQASDTAAELGIAFDVQALKAKGLARFLDEVIVATDGNEEAMAKLFGSVEALGAVLSFAGGGGEKFSQILVDMEQKLGATDAAVEKVSKGFDQRWSRAVAATSDIALGVGDVLLRVFVPALEATSELAQLAAENADFFAASLGILAATKIPAAVAGLGALVTWLGTAEALFIAGAVASRAMAVAMNAIPFVAVATAATGIYRAFRESKVAAEEYARELGELATAQDALTTATKTFYEEVSQANLDAMRTSARANLEAIKEAMAAAQRELDAASFTTNFFGTNLYETERMAAAKAKIQELGAALIEAEARLSAVDHTQENFNRTQAEGDKKAKQITGSIKDLVEAAEKLDGFMGGGSSDFEHLAYLADQIDVLVRAQRDLADHGASSELQATFSQAVLLTDQMGLSAEEAARLREMLEGISADAAFADQAIALADVVRFVGDATGGLGHMNEAAFAVYDSLLKALNTSLSMSQVDYSTAIDSAVVSANQLAHQFGIAYGYASALASMETTTQTLSFGGSVPSGSAADGVGLGIPGTGKPLSYNPASIDVPKIKLEKPSLPGGIGGGGGGGRGGGGSKGLSDEAREAERWIERTKTAVERYNEELRELAELNE